jgi:hypothetical protein
MEDQRKVSELIEGLLERYQGQGINARRKFIEVVNNPPEVIGEDVILEASVLLNAMADSELKIAMIMGMVKKPAAPEPVNPKSTLNVVN